MPLHYARAVLIAGAPIIWDYFKWMRKYAKNPTKYPFEKRYKDVQKLLRTLSRGFNVEYHVEGLEKLPEGNVSFACNHLSAYDPVTLICVLDKPCTFVAKKELIDKPFIGKIIKGIEGQYIDRKDLKQSLRVMMNVENDFKTRADKSWIIFPEGTRNRDPMNNLLMFHHGTFRPAVKSNTPIVPVALYGTFRVLKRKPAYKKYPIFIKFLDPIYPEQYKDMSTLDIAKIVEYKIEQAVSFDLRKKDHLEMAKIDKNYRFNKIY